MGFIARDGRASHAHEADAFLRPDAVFHQSSPVRNSRKVVVRRAQRRVSWKDGESAWSCFELLGTSGFVKNEVWKTDNAVQIACPSTALG